MAGGCSRRVTSLGRIPRGPSMFRCRGRMRGWRGSDDAIPCRHGCVCYRSSLSSRGCAVRGCAGVPRCPSCSSDGQRSLGVSSCAVFRWFFNGASRRAPFGSVGARSLKRGPSSSFARRVVCDECPPSSGCPAIRPAVMAGRAAAYPRPSSMRMRTDARKRPRSMRLAR